LIAAEKKLYEMKGIKGNEKFITDKEIEKGRENLESALDNNNKASPFQWHIKKLSLTLPALVSVHQSRLHK
jgi:hypothetical protein